MDGWNDIEKERREPDRKFKRQGQKIIIIADNCPPHLEIKVLKSIDLHFFLSNTTSCTKPMNQGMIRYVAFALNKFVFKSFLKKYLAHRNRLTFIEEQVFLQK